METNGKAMHDLVDTIGYEFKLGKANESVSLLKQKLYKTHDLIKQYTDKVKEIDKLKSDVETAKREAKQMLCNYKSSMIQTRELEIRLREAKQENTKLINKINEYEIAAAADKQNVQQLTCKIKEMEEQHSIKIMEFDLEKSSFRDRIRTLENEIKMLNGSEPKARKKGKKSSPTNVNDVTESNIQVKSTSEVGINVSLCDIVLLAKPEMQERSVMTDEFYNLKNDPYPLFCAECKVHLCPPPVEEICRLMSICPEPIEEYPFPSPKMTLLPSHSSSSISIRDTEDTDTNENIASTEVISVRHMAHLPNNSQCNTSMTKDPKFQFPTMQSCQNVELENKHLTLRTSVANLSDNVSLLTVASPQNTDHARQDLCSDVLLATNTCSVKELQRKVDSLEINMKKQLQKLRKKQNFNYCHHHCVRSVNSDNSMNSNLLAIICKNMIDFYKDKKCNEKEISDDKKKQYQNKLRKSEYSRKKTKVKKKELSRRCKNGWQIEHINTECLKNINILESEHELLLRAKKSSDALSDTNTYDTSMISNTDVSYKTESSFQGENTPSKTDTFVKYNSTSSSVNRTYTNSNYLSIDKERLTDSDCQGMTSMACSLIRNNENSTDYANNRIFTNLEKNICQGKQHTSERPLKRIKSLKRKIQSNLHVDKQENQLMDTDYNSEYYKSAKKLRIAHIPLKQISPLDIVEEDFLKKSNKDQRLVAQKDHLFDTIEHYENNTVECIEESIGSIDKECVNEGLNIILTTENDICNNDNFGSSTIGNEHVFSLVEFNERDDFVKSMNNKEILTERLITDKSNDSDKLNVIFHNDLRDTTTKDFDCDKSLADDELSRKNIESVVNTLLISALERPYNTIKDTLPKNNINEKFNEEGILKEIAVDGELMANRSVDRQLEATHCEYLSNENEVSVKKKKTSQFSRFSSFMDSKIIAGAIPRETSDRIDVENYNSEIIKLSEDVGEREPQTPIYRLNRYINRKVINGRSSRKKISHLCTITDRFVIKQLHRLLDSAWEASIHYDVLEKLSNTCGPRIIAKCIVRLLSEYSQCDNVLDKSFTPPAPLMTTFQQKLTALLVDLELSKPTVIHLVQAGIEYKLFKLNSELQKSEIDAMTRVYVALARIQKDREKIRMMCCDALYCMGVHAMSLLYTVLTCWPEVLPDAESNKEILPKCIAFLIASQQIDGIYPKLLSLKALISSFYNYSYAQQVTSDIIEECLTALKGERQNGLNTAIILIAKREGTVWTYKNIVRSVLLPMIINHEHPCIYAAFSLLGKLIRTFPLEDKGDIVKEISEQLSDLLESGEGSDDQQEGIVSALLSLSRHKFTTVATSLMKWTPKKSLRPNTIAQIEAFIRTRTPIFWKRYLQKNKCIKRIQSKT